ncbi:MAG TPA: hypothetical protein DGO43_09685 [Chloroflexi bacterium]|nr:hypothetical protein [Chloroflexota bacterium]|tara:strand:+ start:142 stop:1491 length:1350 start_codon:yes stop_codon:yes gene_type:complete
MIHPEPDGLSLSLRPPYRPRALNISSGHIAVWVLALLSAIGVVAYVLKLITAWGDRAQWAYPTVALMFVLSTATAAPLLAYMSRLAKGYWALPLRRITALYAIPSLLSFVLLIPIMTTVPTLEGRANLWFGFSAGAPFLTDALALAILLLTGFALLWFSAVPDIAGPPSRVQAMSPLRRLLYLNWSGTKRQWKVLKLANLTLGAFYLMGYAFVHMLLTTDLGQSLLPGWRSGIFPLYSGVTGIQAAIATTIITLALVRRFSPEGRRFIGDEQAASLGKLLLATVLAWFYFFWSDFLLIWYARLPGEVTALQTNVAITYKLPFLLALFLMFILPFIALIFNPIRRSLARLAWVSLLVLVGLVFDRIRFFVAPMANESPFGHAVIELPAPVWPNPLDVLFVLGTIGLMYGIYVLALTRIPIFNGWELRQGTMLRKERTYMKAHVLVIGKPD